MKEKLTFIITLVGGFSATIILLINHALTILGVDTTGYVDIINIVGMGLAVVLLVVSVVFFNKFNVVQQKAITEQNNTVNNALDNNATILQTLLPELALKILSGAEEQAQVMIKNSEVQINTMMNEMLPALAEQTMRLVTEKSQTIVEETTAKANSTMEMMTELIPTYSRQISDSVAQTVRENNAHYQKMLTEIKQLVTSKLPTTPSPTSNNT